MNTLPAKAFRIVEKKPAKITLGVILALSLIAAITVPLYLIYTSRDQASAHLDGFDPGNIMSDFVMGNKSTMTEAQINNFLHSKNPCNKAYDDEVKYWQGQGYIYGISGNRVLCMADDKFDGESAAHIIWQAAQDYSINPQVLIVLLEKEQSLVTDPWPNHRQYASATGFDCPDTGGCDPRGAGFKNQVRKAAALFREVLDGGWSNYPAYTTQFIYYNPNTGCGGTNIYIQNRATSALYRYTPYQPNAAALAAGKGTGDSCSSYGNRNFYNLFTEWFGSTQSYEISGEIAKRYNELNGSMGQPIAQMVYAGNDIWWQEFENGVIIGSGKTGFWENHGAIRTRWGELGYQSGALGLPTGPIVYAGNDTWWQTYENGAIIGSGKTGFWENYGGVRERWGELGYQTGSLGFPTAATFSGKDGTMWQEFEGGFIIGKPSAGFWESNGEIRRRWGELGYQTGSLGYPTGPIVYAGNDTWWQTYENGAVIGSGGTGFWESKGSIRKRWGELGYQTGVMGMPTSGEESDSTSTWQRFENGIIIGDSDTGYWESKGAIREQWAKVGYHQATGNPTGPEIYDPSTKTWHQNYEKGTIYYSEGRGGWYVAN